MRETPYQLLLETPATEANVERFVNKYYRTRIDNTLQMLYGMHAQARRRELTAFEKDQIKDTTVEPYYIVAKTFLNKWTDRVQQILRSRGESPDIFSYQSFEDVEDALERALVPTDALKQNLQPQKEKKPVEDTQGLRKIADTSTLVAFQPLTVEASKKYFGKPYRISVLDGQIKKGTRWCTSGSQAESFWNEYVIQDKSRLIYFVRKSDDSMYAMKNVGTYSEDQLRASFYRLIKKIDGSDFLRSAGGAFFKIESGKLVATNSKAESLFNNSYDMFLDIVSRRLSAMIGYSSTGGAVGNNDWPVIECRDSNNDRLTIVQLYNALIKGIDSQELTMQGNEMQPLLAEIEQVLRFIVYFVYNDFKPVQV